VRKLVLAAVAVGVLASGDATFAADLARPIYKAPVAAPPVVYNWSGCYLGVEGGGNWGRSSHVARSSVNAGLQITGDFDLSGGLAGGTVGCNLQFSSFVIGIEDDFSWTNKSGSRNDVLPFNLNAVSTTREKWIDTLRGRAGYAWDRFLVYGTGGVAWAGSEVNVVNPVVAASVTDAQTRTGWVVGVGAEWAAWTGAWGALSFKLEYLHADFGTGTYINPPVPVPGGTIVTRDVRLTDDIVRAGMNLKFNWWEPGPLVARY